MELGIVDRASNWTDRTDAQKNTLKPHRRQQWVIPPKANSAFVAAMEDVLAVYTRPRDPDCRWFAWTRPRSSSLLKFTCDPDASRTPGPLRLRVRTQRHRNLFMMFAPLEGWRHVKVTDRHTYAHVLKDLADIHFSHARTIVLVQDNLNIHSRGVALRGLPCRPSQAPGRTLRMALHTKARQAGSIWRSPNSASYRPSASTAASPTNKPSSTKSRSTAMPITPRPIGTSQPPTLASNSGTHLLPAIWLEVERSCHP